MCAAAKRIAASLPGSESDYRVFDLESASFMELDSSHPTGSFRICEAVDTADDWSARRWSRPTAGAQF